MFPDVSPGYMKQVLPSEAPFEGEKWDDIFQDIERVIMPGVYLSYRKICLHKFDLIIFYSKVTHWQSPHMHAYFPALNSYPSMLGDMISDAINCIGFTWASSPACTELESLVMDWLVKSLGLPNKFLSSNEEPYGGGVLHVIIQIILLLQN